MKKKRKTTVKEFAEKRVKAWNILLFLFRPCCIYSRASISRLVGFRSFRLSLKPKICKIYIF